MVEAKPFRVFQLLKETHNYVNLETGAGVCDNNMDEQTWRDVVVGRFKYYYDLETMCVDRAAFCPKATSARISVGGYQPNDDPSSNSRDNDDISKSHITMFQEMCDFTAHPLTADLG